MLKVFVSSQCSVVPGFVSESVLLFITGFLLPEGEGRTNLNHIIGKPKKDDSEILLFCSKALCVLNGYVTESGF